MNYRAFVLYLHSIIYIDFTKSDFIKPNKLELNIGELKIYIGQLKDDTAVYVSENDSHKDKADKLPLNRYFSSSQEESTIWKEAEKKENGSGWNDENWKEKNTGFQNMNWNSGGDGFKDKMSEEKKIYRKEGQITDAREHQENNASWKTKTQLNKVKDFSTNDKQLLVRQKPQNREDNFIESSNNGTQNKESKIQTWQEISEKWKKVNTDIRYKVKETLKKDTFPSIKSDSEFEERVYPSTLFACSEEKRLDSLQIGNQFQQLFLRLYEYLQGQNYKRVFQNMTLPVFSIFHLNTEYVTDKLAMCFWITQEDEETVAEPTPGADVFLWRMKSTSFFVRRFSGSGGDTHGEIWEKELHILNKGVEAEGLSPVTDTHLLLLASYDAPWTTEGRRDEVLLRKTKDGEGQWIGPWTKMVDDK